MTFEITIKPSDHRFDCAADESILAGALRAGLLLPYGCRDGACGSCKSRLVAGDVDFGLHQPATLTDIEKRQGYVLPCVARPRSAVTLECREVRRAGDIQIRKLPCRIERIETPAPDVAIVSLKLPANERLQFMAGQYIDILLKDGGRRSFSLATPPHDDGFLQLHVRHMPDGAFTGHLFRDLPVKEILRIEGPHGAFYLRETSDKPMILVAGGTGFAPIKSVIEHAFHQGVDREMVLYWGARSLVDLYLATLPGQWQQQHDNFTFIPVLSEPRADERWPGRTGLVHQAVLDDFTDLSAWQVYACGAPMMIQAARRDFIQLRRLPEDEFFADSFTSAVQSQISPA
ncbi:MAG: CDP-6-deoxy-delta-3,4-glucoseen reductase [Betaproteobacteria bacterium]